MIMSAKALLNENPSPTEEEVKKALSGNFCRCISHYHVVKAVTAASPKGDVTSIGRPVPIHWPGHTKTGWSGDRHGKHPLPQ